jgi:hypothetical protein
MICSIKMKKPGAGPGFGLKQDVSGGKVVEWTGLSHSITALMLPWSGGLTFAHNHVIVDKCDKPVEREAGDKQPSDKAKHESSLQLFLMNE